MNSSSIHSRVLRSADDMWGIVADWRELWQRCPRSSTFQSPEWLLSWMDAFNPGNVRAVEVRRSGRLIGLAPLLMYERDADKVLAFMGGGVSDYLDVLVDPHEAAPVIDCFLQTVPEIASWTVLEFTDLPAWSVLRRTHFAQRLAVHDSCSTLELPHSSDGLLHIFSNRQRANLRNASSRLRKAGGAEIQLATAETLPEFLDDLFRLHTARWQQAGQPGVLEEEKVRNFHRIVALRLLEQNALRLYRLRSEQGTLAVIEAFVERETALCYTQGFDPAFSYFSPGTQLMFAVIQEAVRAGVRRFDFLRGTEAYKQHWRAKPEATYRLTHSRSELELWRVRRAA